MFIPNDKTCNTGELSNDMFRRIIGKSQTWFTCFSIGMTCKYFSGVTDVFREKSDFEGMCSGGSRGKLDT